MKLLGNLILFFFPSFLQVPVRRLFGQRIGRGSKIRFGTLLLAGEIQIGNQVSIGPFCVIRGEQVTIGDHSQVKPLSLISTRIIFFGKYVHVAPLSIISGEFTERSRIEVGDHSRIFPFCWLETGEGISIGRHVSVGGHTLIFTHGVWPDYLDGGPVSYGPVTIRDNVYIPWRVFILANVDIGENTIIGANSLVNKSFPNNVLIGGSPAKIIKENIGGPINPEEKLDRATEILKAFSEHIRFKYKAASSLHSASLQLENGNIVIDDTALVSGGDLLITVNLTLTDSESEALLKKGISVLNHQEKTIMLSGQQKWHRWFITFLRKYGIRLYIYHK